ncbi:hypothetical protein Glove_242g94 [Diversispora epigaea]|uniref:Uncharacterized protein n=1 Tax=Diversispora epigaea TaxID=1348612 RepID=A0A397IFG2_9GLOM|nr:hypothetical protein Glove_242g94 [Diversispora epigaea]
MKFSHGCDKLTWMCKLWKRSSSLVHSEDPQAQQSSPKNSLLRHFNITKFKIDCAKYFEKENQVVHYCTKYLNDFPTSYNTMCDRAEAYGKLKKYDKAIDDLNSAILLRPQRSTAWCLRGVIKGLKKSYTDALDDLNKAIVIDPIDCLALKWRAFCYYMLKSYEQALLDLNMVIILGCSDTFTYINKANINRELKNLDETYKDAASEPSSIIDATSKIILSSFSDSEIDSNINVSSNVNDTEEKSVVNNINLTHEESSIKPASIIDTASKTVLLSSGDPEVDININALSNVNNTEKKSVINNINLTQEEPSIKPALTTDTTSKTVLLLSFGNPEVDININANINDPEEKSIINNINSTQEELFIKPALITDKTSNVVLSSFSDPEVDININELSNVNDTEEKSVINNINLTQEEPSCELTSIADTTSKFVLSSFSDSGVDSNINALSNINDMEEKSIINNFNSTQKEPSCELTSITDTTSKIKMLPLLKLTSSNYTEEERLNNINEILGEILNRVEMIKKYREQQRKKK